MSICLLVHLRIPWLSIHLTNKDRPPIVMPPGIMLGSRDRVANSYDFLVLQSSHSMEMGQPLITQQCCFVDSCKSYIGGQHFKAKIVWGRGVIGKLRSAKRVGINGAEEAEADRREEHCIPAKAATTAAVRTSVWAWWSVLMLTVLLILLALLSTTLTHCFAVRKPAGRFWKPLSSLRWKFPSFSRVWAHCHARWASSEWLLCNLIIFMSC